VVEEFERGQWIGFAVGILCHQTTAGNDPW
jgi:hypothetical protein